MPCTTDAQKGAGVNPIMWMGIAGIIGTAVSPWIAERLRSKNARKDQLMKLRIAIYAELLKGTAHLAAQAHAGAPNPATELEEIGTDELHGLLSQAKVVAGPDVLRHLEELSQQIDSLNRSADLADAAGNIASAHAKVQDAIRGEMMR